MLSCHSNGLYFFFLSLPLTYFLLLVRKALKGKKGKTKKVRKLILGTQGELQPSQTNRQTARLIIKLSLSFLYFFLYVIPCHLTAVGAQTNSQPGPVYFLFFLFYSSPKEVILLILFSFLFSTKSIYSSLFARSENFFLFLFSPSSF